MAAESPNVFEVYIRFNNDNEKDYCFNVDDETTFDDLNKIFTTLPIALRPSLFYHPKPTGFKYSVNPGYLTANGGLLYSYNVDNLFFLKLPKSQLDRISDYVWPSQLIFPVWEFNHFYHLNFVLILLAWLYTDLPDFISPTPGICLSNQMLRATAYLVTLAGPDYQVYADNIIKETSAHGTTQTLQILFFAFHFIKLIIIYLCLFVGLLNPIESNPLKVFYNRMLDLVKTSVLNQPENTHDKFGNLKPEDLIAIGWTGSRRLTLDDYKENYKNVIIENAGGIVKAHQKGLLKNINKNLGVYLDNDEGFGTPLPKDHRQQLKKYPSSPLSVLDFPEVLNEFKLKIQEEKAIEEESNDSEVIIKESQDGFNPLFTDSDKGKFKLSYRYLAFYTISFLVDNNLLNNPDLVNKLYKFNSNELVKSYRKYGSYANNGAQWNKFFEERAQLGNYAKGERFSESTVTGQKPKEE